MAGCRGGAGHDRQSGLRLRRAAVVTAALEIASGLHDVAVAGGMENMDRAPYLMDGGRWGYRMGPAQILDSMLTDGLNDAFSGSHSGWHTEDLVARSQITRAEQDAFAARSQQRFAGGPGRSRFTEEIVAVEVKGRKGIELFSVDEAPRPDTTVETLARLRPAFRPEGTITAGNAPGLNSAAAAMIVAERAFAEKSGFGRPRTAGRLRHCGRGAGSLRPRSGAGGGARRSSMPAGRSATSNGSRSTRPSPPYPSRWPVSLVCRRTS